MKKEELEKQTRVLDFLNRYDPSLELTITEVARYFGVTRQYIRKMINAYNINVKFTEQRINEHQANQLRVNNKIRIFLNERS